MATYTHPISKADLETLQAQRSYTRRDFELKHSQKGPEYLNERIYEFMFPKLTIDPPRLYAANNGRIIRAIESDIAMFLDSDAAHDTNIVGILTEDGITIEYIHIKPSVMTGVKVKKGDEIGVLAHGLHSKNRHLHVKTSKKGGRVKPIKFKAI